MPLIVRANDNPRRMSRTCALDRCQRRLHRVGEIALSCSNISLLRHELFGVMTIPALLYALQDDVLGYRSSVLSFP